MKLLLLMLFAFATTCQAQFDIETADVTILKGVKSSQQIGDLLLVETSKKVSLVGAMKLTAETDEEIAWWDVEAQNRDLIDFDSSDDQRSIYIAKPGKAFVTVVLKNFQRKRIVVNVKGGSITGGLDVAEPNQELRDLVSPIIAKLQTDPEKAARVAPVFVGFAKAIRGSPGSKVSNARIFGQINAASFKDLSMAGGVSIGSELESILSQYVGIKAVDDGFEDKKLNAGDRLKIAEVFDAVAWGATQ